MFKDTSIIILILGIVLCLVFLGKIMYHIYKYHNANLKFSLDIKNMVCLYISIMVFGITITSLSNSTSTLFWSINAVSLIILFGGYTFKCTKYALFFSCLYIIIWLFGLFINMDLVKNDLKAIGTNINGLIVPIYILILSYVNKRKKIDDRSVIKIFKWLSVWGLIVAIIAWIVGYQDILSGLGGSMGVYQTHGYGFFNNKNIYGIFIALSLCADLYLLKTQSNKLFFTILCVFKFVAVVVSFSRAALLFTCITTFLFFWFERKRSIKAWGTLIIILLVVLFYSIQNPDVLDIVLNKIFRLEIGDAGRSFAREEALSDIDSVVTYVFGVGYGGIDYYNIDIDNGWLAIFFSGGIIRCIIYCGIILYSFIVMHRLTLQNKILGNLCWSVGLSYIIYANFEAITLLELGLINFIFMLFMYFIPCGYRQNIE